MFSLDGFNFGILISWSAVLYHKDTNCNSRWNEEKRPSSSWPKSYSGEDIQQRSKMRKWDRSRPAGLCPWSGSWSLSWQLQITPPPPPYSLYGFIKNALGCDPFSLLWICGHYWLLLCLKMCHVFWSHSDLLSFKEGSQFTHLAITYISGSPSAWKAPFIYLGR